MRAKDVKKEISKNVLRSNMLLVSNHQSEDSPHIEIEIKTKIIKKIVPHVVAPSLNISRIFYLKF